MQVLAEILIIKSSATEWKPLKSEKCLKTILVLRINQEEHSEAT